jgi:ribonuclease HI
MSNYRIYVDGSAIGNINVTADTPAGWGLVVVEVDENDLKSGVALHSQGREVEQHYGKVITDANHPKYIGAEVGSNNTGELSAIYWALTIIQDNNDTNDVFTIYGDSMYAGKMASREWRPKENVDLVRKVADLWDSLSRAGHNFSWLHVKAHSGHKWNDLADRLASTAASGE